MKLKFLLLAIIAPTLSLAAYDRASVKETVKANKAQMRPCYKDALAKDPNLQGTVTVAWEIGDGGGVKSAQVEQGAGTTIKDEQVQKCVVETLKTWTFAAPPKGENVKISFPFDFKKL